MIIDLHTHTTYSDGKFSVKDLLKYAKQKNIDILAITDHDSVGAHIELLNSDVKGIFDGKILVGSEINAVFAGAKIDLLAYNFDLIELKKWLDSKYSKEKQNENLKDEFIHLVKLCHANKMKIDSEMVYNPQVEYPIARIYREIKKYEENRIMFTEQEWNNSESFYRSCTCNSKFILYIDFSHNTPNAKECTGVVRNAGGRIFLAHLFKYNIPDYVVFLDKLMSQNILDGIEVYYPTFTREQTQFLEEYCIKNNLLMSCGSDYHGESIVTDETAVWSSLDKIKYDPKDILKWINDI